MADKVIYLRDPNRESGERVYKIKYAELLNAAQLAAVTHRDGPLLVIAGAGSGKTRTLIYRVARLIESGVPPGCDPADDVYPARGAGDARAGRAAGRREPRAVAGGTFHSFANNILRRHGAQMGLKPNFTILDRVAIWRT